MGGREDAIENTAIPMGPYTGWGWSPTENGWPPMSGRVLQLGRITETKDEIHAKDPF
jgi:hypothetical protein